MPVVASAADEESEHHNLPAVLENTIVVNSVTHDASFTPPSYLYLNGCTNYGANISVSVESDSCSSEATGKTGGIVGLAESAAAVAMADNVIAPYPGLPSASGPPVALSANEITQLVTMSADDIDFATAAPPQRSRPQQQGAHHCPWSRRPAIRPARASTHQRIRPDRRGPHRSMDRRAEIPPKPRSTECPGTKCYSITADDGLGLVGTPRSPSWRYEVQVAAGETPAQGRLASGGQWQWSRGPPGVLATVACPGRRSVPEFGEPGGIARHGGGQPDADKYMFTVRIVVQDAAGNGRHGPAGRVPPQRRQPPRRFAHRALEFDRPLHRFSPPSAPAGPTHCWWPPPMARSTPTGRTAATSRGGRSTHPPTPASTQERRHIRSGGARYRGEIVGGVAVGDLADATGHDLDVVATDLTGQVWAWNARDSFSRVGRCEPTRPFRALTWPTPTTRC